MEFDRVHRLINVVIHADRRSLDVQAIPGSADAGLSHSALTSFANKD
jgi:hypothetical protein